MITKKELLTGVIKFVKGEVIPHVSDKSLQIVLSAALYAINSKPDITNQFLNNSIVSTILQGEDGKYDTELVFSVLDSVVEEYGGIPITIPPISFIKPTETTLTFYSTDIKRLKEYIAKEANDA